MGRPHIEFIHATDVPLRPVTDGPLAGVRWRVLSSDDETGAATALTTFASGWALDAGGLERRMEILTLRGRMSVDGSPLAEGAYIDIPAGATSATLRCDGDAEALVMIEDVATPDEQGGEIATVDTHALSLELPGPDVPAGLAVKRLRVDARHGDWTWIGAGAPEYLEHRAEIHPTVEEGFVLRGDVLLGSRGEMRAGDYFWRPPNVRHGPIYCRSGRLILFRTKGGGLRTTYEEVPEWPQIVAEYRSREAFYQGP